MQTFLLSHVDSPLGNIHFIHQDDILYALEFDEFKDRLTQALTRYSPTAFQLVQCETSAIHPLLAAYFLGNLAALDNIIVNPLGTPFQQQVWQALRTIPAGKTASYVQIAQQIAKTNGQRAVGMANGKNPIPLVIPCHRVINHNGKLGGYSGALWRKEWLLKHEGSYCQKTP